MEFVVKEPNDDSYIQLNYRICETILVQTTSYRLGQILRMKVNLLVSRVTYKVRTSGKSWFSSFDEATSTS